MCDECDFQWIEHFFSTIWLLLFINCVLPHSHNQEEKENMEAITSQVRRSRSSLNRANVTYDDDDDEEDSMGYCCNFYFNNNFAGMFRFNELFSVYSWLTFLSESASDAINIDVLIHSYPEVSDEFETKFLNLDSMKYQGNFLKFKSHPRVAFSVAQFCKGILPDTIPMCEHMLNFCKKNHGECLYYHMVVQALEFTLCAEWICMGIDLYISMPRLMKICEDDTLYKVVLVLDLQFGNFIFISENQKTKEIKNFLKKETSNYLLFEQCFENLPGKFKDTTPSLSAFCLQTFWKYDLLKRNWCPNHLKLVNNLKEVEPFLRKTLHWHYRSIFMERKEPKLAKLRKEAFTCDTIAS